MMPEAIAAEAEDVEAAESWRAYLAEPLHDADPDRLAGCFRTPGLAAHLGKLAAEPRFDSRLAAILTTHFAAPSATVVTPLPLGADLVLVRLVRDQLEALSLPCGTVFWSGAFVREIRKPVVGAMTERFGDAAFDAALAHRDLGGGRPVPADLDALEQVIRADGRACLAAWIRSLPEPIAERVRMKWPDNAAVPTTSDPLLLKLGPQILRRVAAELQSDTAEQDAP